MITADPDRASEAVARGAAVVLVVPAEPEGRAAQTPRPAASPRLAVLVGDHADPSVRAAAEQMHAELFPGG